jgi:hypothetical protein
MKPIENPLADNNKTTAAHLRDDELAIVADKIRPIDLRSIPRERWDEFVNFHLTLPEHLLDAIGGGPVDPKLVPALEEAVERFHGITAPYFVIATFEIQQLGRSWRFVPEAAEFMTGFLLDKEDDK